MQVFGIVEMDGAGDVAGGELCAPVRHIHFRAVRHAARIDDAHARIVEMFRKPRDVDERCAHQTATATAERPNRFSASSAMYVPMASDDVAAGDGALRT